MVASVNGPTADREEALGSFRTAGQRSRVVSFLTHSGKCANWSNAKKTELQTEGGPYDTELEEIQKTYVGGRDRGHSV